MNPSVNPNEWIALINSFSSAWSLQFQRQTKIITVGSPQERAVWILLVLCDVATVIRRHLRKPSVGACRWEGRFHTGLKRGSELRTVPNSDHFSEPGDLLFKISDTLDRHFQRINPFCHTR